jgi:hypothetical protein
VERDGCQFFCASECSVTVIALFSIFIAFSGFSSTIPRTQQLVIGNLLQNGSFENDAPQLGTTRLQGWSVIRSNVDVIPNNAAALWAWHQSADGTKSLELTGNPGAATIEQSFPTEVGRKYVFSGWISHHYYVQQAGVNVYVNGVALEPLYHSGQASQANMNWQSFTREFEARSTVTTLRLEDRNLANWPWGGAVLDGLAVTATASNPTVKEGCVSIQIAPQWELPSDVVSALTLSEKLKFQQQGMTLEGNVLKSKPAPARGYWVKAGNGIFQVEENGVVRINNLSGNEGSAAVFRSYSDAQSSTVKPVISFSLAGLSNNCSNPPIISIPIAINGISGMDSSPLASNLMGTESVLAGCKLWEEGVPDPITFYNRLDYNRTINGKTEGCCLDYTNPDGDKTKYKTEQSAHCETQRIKNFFFSTCASWTIGPHIECWNEGGVQKFLGGTGSSCWENHKYRNCQQMDTRGLSFKVSPIYTSDEISQENINLTLSTTASCFINIYNTTPKNESVLRVVKPGGGTLYIYTFNGITGNPEIKPVSGTYVIKHYHDGFNITPSSKVLGRHFDKILVFYNAPILKKGEAPYSVSFSLEAYGLTRTLNLTAVPPTI